MFGRVIKTRPPIRKPPTKRPTNGGSRPYSSSRPLSTSRRATDSFTNDISYSVSDDLDWRERLSDEELNGQLSDDFEVNSCASTRTITQSKTTKKRKTETECKEPETTQTEEKESKESEKGTDAKKIQDSQFDVNTAELFLESVSEVESLWTNALAERGFVLNPKTVFKGKVPEKHNWILDLGFDTNTTGLILFAADIYDFSSRTLSWTLNFFGLKPKTSEPSTADTQVVILEADSTSKMQQILNSPNAKLPHTLDYIENIKVVYRVYKECFATLETMKKCEDIDCLAATNQLSGGYKVDNHQIRSIEEIKEILNIPSNKAFTLLNLIVDADKNTNSTLLVHMVKNLIDHPANDQSAEQVVRFLKLVRELFPERLIAELKVQKVPCDVIKKLMENELDNVLVNLWKDSLKDIKLPLAHSQWCAVPNGLRTGKIEDYYKLLQIDEHPKFGRKASLILLSVPMEHESNIRVAFSQAQANTDKGQGGVYQTYLHEVDMLFLLHVGTQRIIYQNDNTGEYDHQKISERDEQGNNIVTIGKNSSSSSSSTIHIEPSSTSQSVTDEDSGMKFV